MVSTQLIERFKKVIEEDYGQVVSLEDASEILNDLTAYFDLLASIHHKNLEVNPEKGHGPKE